MPHDLRTAREARRVIKIAACSSKSVTALVDQALGVPALIKGPGMVELVSLGSGEGGRGLGGGRVKTSRHSYS